MTYNELISKFTVLKDFSEELEESRSLIWHVKYNKNWRFRKIAVTLFEEIGEAAVEPLIVALKDEKWWVREMAAIALGRIGDKRAIEPLIQALQDRDRDVRKQAAIALGRINTKNN